jgi:hypothetical protein
VRSVRTIAVAICIASNFLSLHLAFSQENVVIVLDDSGSMNTKMQSRSSRMDAAKKALASVLKQFRPDTKLGLLLLNGARNHDHWAIPLDHLSANQATKLILSLHADGGTPLGERLREGADALLKLREKQFYGNYRLLVVSDGEAEDRKMLDAYLPDILSRGIMVDAIGVDMSQDHSLATRVHSYRRADDDAALEKALQEVFAERIESSGDGSQEDYRLLQAIDDSTAKDVLAAISKSNNSAITATKKPEQWSASGDTVSRSFPMAGVLVGMFICIAPVLLMVIAITLLAAKLGRRHRS